VSNLRHCMTVIGATYLLSFTSLGFGANGDEQLVRSLEKSLPQLVAAGDYRSASSAAFRLASARSRLGESAAACEALSHSLEYYRIGVAKQSGVFEPAMASITDDSDGMAQVRARFGCKAG